MGKGKKKGGDEQQQKKPKAIPVVRGSLPRTRARKESRQECHRRQVARKTRKLERRIKILEDRGICYPDRPDMSVGTRHKRMRRLARLKGIIGLPLRRKPPKEKPEKKTEVSSG